MVGEFLAVIAGNGVYHGIHSSNRSIAPSSTVLASLFAICHILSIPVALSFMVSSAPLCPAPIIRSISKSPKRSFLSIMAGLWSMSTLSGMCPLPALAAPNFYISPPLFLNAGRVCPPAFCPAIRRGISFRAIRRAGPFS